MERATRERLTGAVILVAALAILVPEMLSGPGGDDVAREPVADTGPPLTTYDLTIDSSAAPAASRQQQLSSVASQAQAIAEAVPPPVTASPASQADATEDTPPDPVGGSAAKVEQPAAAQTPTATPPLTPTPTPAPATQRPAATAAGAWWVQLGSFSSAQNAQGLARKLRAQGFDIEVSVVRSGGKDLHRVRAGPEKDRAAATALRGRLAAAGEQGTLVAP